MKRVLITGATGNIGLETVSYLTELSVQLDIIVAVRNIENAKSRLNHLPNLDYRRFDFKDHTTFRDALQDVDILFLLRPPELSQVDLYFEPLLKSAKERGIQNILFLSVQGAEKSKLIPHHKIEKLIKEFGFNYIFVRPSYFMQNLTTSFLEEIRQNRSITLPAGDAKFNWIDAKNIGEAIAQLIINFETYKNEAIVITGYENLSFQEVTNIMTDIFKQDVTYKKLNPISFYFKKRKNGVTHGFAVVMTILHYLPRFQKEPEISKFYEKLTGKKPMILKEFIKREKEKFIISDQKL